MPKADGYVSIESKALKVYVLNLMEAGTFYLNLKELFVLLKEDSADYTIVILEAKSQEC